MGILSKKNIVTPGVALVDAARGVTYMRYPEFAGGYYPSPTIAGMGMEYRLLHYPPLFQTYGIPVGSFPVPDPGVQGQAVPVQPVWPGYSTRAEPM